MKSGLAFQDCPEYARLQGMAASPYDLTRPGALGRERLLGYRASVAGYDYLYATERVDDGVLAALGELAARRQVVKRFAAMRRGEVVNRIEGFASENRAVLHTAVRDLFGGAPCHAAATAEAEAELTRLAAFLEELECGAVVNHRGESFTDLVMVGIGGSDLGPRALYLALRAFEDNGRRVHFISNVDPDDAAAVLAGLDLSRTLVNVVSKSGSTLETRTNEELVRRAFIDQGLDPGRHFLAVTGKGSPMDDPARYLRSFYMYDYIGGRYSATSMVGGVMLAFALGIDKFREILRGANEVDQAAENPDLRGNIPLLMAMIGIWNRNFLGCDTVAVLPYSQALLRFAAHLQQCDMESNGKSIDRYGRSLCFDSGPIVWGEPGTNGQHAFYQLIHQGTVTVPVEFIGFRESQRRRDIEVDGTTSQQKLVANLLAQSMALATGQENDNPNRRFPGNRPNSILIADRLTPYAMGALLAIYEAKIVFQGFAWDINSFDQEGVQLGKTLAARILGRMAAGGSGGDEDPAASAMLEAAGIF